MRIVDSQLHAPALGAAWEHGEESALAAQCEAIIAAMDAVGVEAAIVAPRHDAAVGALAAARHPTRLARVVMLDPDDPEIDTRVAEARDMESVVALRQVVADYIGDHGTQDLEAGRYDRLLAAAEQRGMPIFLLAPGFPTALARIARLFPKLTMVVDHFGLRQYPPLTMDADPWEKLPGLLSLAEFPNVAVKFCGAQLLSQAPYPHADVWPYLDRVVDAFGAERLMWASDFTRLRMVPAGAPWRGTYADALRFVQDSDRLSDQQKEWILGGTARRLLGWPAGALTLP